MPGPTPAAGKPRRGDPVVPPAGTWRQGKHPAADAPSLEDEWQAARLALVCLEEQRERLKSRIPRLFPLGRENYRNLVLITCVISVELDMLARWSRLWPKAWATLQAEYSRYSAQQAWRGAFLSRHTRELARAEAEWRSRELGRRHSAPALVPSGVLDVLPGAAFVAEHPTNPAKRLRKLAPAAGVVAAIGVAALMVPTLDQGGGQSRIAAVHRHHPAESPAAAQLVPRLRWRGTESAGGSADGARKSAGSGDASRPVSQKQAPAKPAATTPVATPAPAPAAPAPAPSAPAPAPAPAAPAPASTSSTPPPEFGFEK
jgi:hypothetical protein